MTFTITGATLIDGNGGAPLQDAAVHIEAQRIAWVGAATKMPAAAQAAQQVDARGKWLLPGLIDAHIHICYNGEESVFALLAKPRDALVLEAVEICKRTLQQGVTTIRDVGGEKYIEMSLRDAINRAGSKVRA